MDIDFLEMPGFLQRPLILVMQQETLAHKCTTCNIYSTTMCRSYAQQVPQSKQAPLMEGSVQGGQRIEVAVQSLSATVDVQTKMSLS